MILFLDKNPVRAAYDLPDAFLVSQLKLCARAFKTWLQDSEAYSVDIPPNLITSEKYLLHPGIRHPIKKDSDEYAIVDWLQETPNNVAWLYTYEQHLYREMWIRGLNAGDFGYDEAIISEIHSDIKDAVDNAHFNFVDSGDAEDPTVPPRKYFNKLVEAYPDMEFESVMSLCRHSFMDSLPTHGVADIEWTIRDQPGWYRPHDIPASGTPAPDYFAPVAETNNFGEEPEPQVSITNFKPPEGSMIIQMDKSVQLMDDLMKQLANEYAMPELVGEQ